MLELIILILGVYILAIMCRSSHKGVLDLKGWSYAHRGLHGNGIPENSMAAFKAALDNGFGIELDIHLLKDGNLAVMHDSLLNRTTGRPGHIEDLTTEDLKHYHLQGTEQTIPEFMDVLTLYNGKAPLIIELKPERNNHAALAEAACRMMDGYKGVYCMESFDPRCVAWLKKNRPDIVRGFLTENFTKTRNDLPDYLRFLLTHCLTNFTCVPDFVAYKFADRKDSISFSLCRKLWKAQGVTWTLKTREEYDTAVNEGLIPIFEGFLPEAKQLNN
ncbi:MAG: glycerophosphodiester phosphodiesterase [Oscillospiraceae bacterium]|nr:glycerophosphodiester phosphodiesterase [Oscillospiraceae bacterium]